MMSLKLSIQVVLLSTAVLLLGLLVSGVPVYAQNDAGSPPASCTLEEASFLGLPTWYKYLEGEVDASRTSRDGGAACSPVLNGFDATLPIGLTILEGLLRISGIVTVVMIFWASVKFLTSNGNGDAAAEARRTAINAVIGLAIVIIATSTVSFIGNRLTNPSLLPYLEKPNNNYATTTKEIT